MHLKVKHKDETRMVIESQGQWKEWLLAGGIAAFGLIGFFLPLSEWYSDEVQYAIRIFFAVTFIWVGIVSMADTEHLVFDKKSKTLRVTRKSLLNHRVYVHQLDSLLDVTVEEAEGKRGYTVMLTFEHNIRVPLSNSSYVSKESQEELASSISKFVELEDTPMHVTFMEASLKNSKKKKKR